MHERGPELAERVTAHLAVGTRVSGTVVCHHVFGLGVWLPEHGQYGHVNITSIAPPGVPLRGPEDFPLIGSVVEGTVLGYTHRDAQLTLSLRPAAAA
jgi:hypothetical protein